MSLGLNKTLGRGQKQDFGVEPGCKANEIDIRWKRIVVNDVENIPIHLIIGLISILNRGNSTINSLSFIAFTVSRYLHTYSYANSLQSHRAIGWFGGLVSTLVLGGNALVGALYQ